MASLRKLRKAAEKQPDNPLRWYELGVALATQQNFEEMRQALLKALGCPVIEPELCLRLGMSLEGTGDPNSAKAAFDRARSLDPRLVDGHKRLGVLLLKESNPEQALGPLNDWLRFSDFSPEACLRYAQALEQVQEQDAAAAYYHIAAHHTPNNAEAHRQLGRILNERGDLVGALRAWRRVLALEPGDTRAMTALGVGLSIRGEHQEAVDLLTAVTRAQPDSAEAFSDLGMALSRSHAHDAALKCLQHAVSLKSDSPQSHLNLGVVLMGAQRYEEAMGTFYHVISLWKDWPIAHYNLGMCLKDLGDLEGARDALARASNLAPEDASIKQALANILYALSSPPTPAPQNAGVGSRSRPGTPLPPQREERLIAPSPPESVLQRRNDAVPRASSTSSMHGEIKSFPLPEVLEFLKLRNSTGTLVVSQPGRLEGRLEMFRGDLTGASSPNTSPLGKLLIRLNKVSETDLQLVMEGTSPSEYEEKVGKVLLDDGVVSASALREALWQQLQMALLEFVEWSEGHFHFIERESSGPDDELLSEYAIDTRQALMEVMKTIDDRRR